MPTVKFNFCSVAFYFLYFRIFVIIQPKQSKQRNAIEINEKCKVFTAVKLKQLYKILLFVCFFCHVNNKFINKHAAVKHWCHLF